VASVAALPNRDLERIWRLRQYVVADHRWRKQRPPPTWHVKPGTWDLQLSGRRELQAYRRAVKAEERKAARYLAQAEVVRTTTSLKIAPPTGF
jgi:hypothetical protein